MRWRSVLCLLLLLFLEVYADNGSNKDELSEENGSKNEEVPVDAEGDNTDNGETDGSEDTTIPTVPTSTIQTTTLDYCHCEMEIYGTDDLSGTLKSPNYPGAHCDNGKCMYKILPHPNMTLRLHVETLDVSSGTTVKFWNILIVDDKEYNMYHSTSGSSEADFGGYEHFTTAVNVGMKVVFEMRKNSYSSKGFKMTFDRKLNDSSNYVCPDAHVVVGGEPTAVSVPKMFSVYSGCSFYLTPSVKGTENHLEEMYIEIEHLDYSYVTIRSYNSDGLFSGDYYSRDKREKLVDASRVEVSFRRTTYSESGFKSPQITAKLMNNSCQCPPSEIRLSRSNFAFDLKSPGFPDLYCPSRRCETLIKSEKTVRKPDDPVIVFLLTFNCSVGDYDRVNLMSLDSGRLIYSTRMSNKPQLTMRPLMIGEQNLHFSYIASSLKQERYFEMMMRYVEMEKRCICALFDDKEYRNGGFLSVTISGSCRLIHCHWKFSAEQDYSLQYITIEFIMDNPHTSDRVYVITDELEEEYDSEILTRRMNSLTSNMGPIDFTFSRFGLTNSEDAVLNITWKTTEACSCASEKFYVKVGEPVVIASPNYPDSYCPNLVCRHTFFAPKGYYLEVSMDEVDLEKYHDYLKIYDGNGTVSPLIAKLTGNVKPSVYNTTSDTLFISFVTDETNSEKGYHANINARPMKIVSDENHNTHWVIFIAIIVLIIGISLGAAIAVLRKEPAVPRRRTQTLENPNSQINPFADGFELGVTVPSASPDQAATY